MYENKVKTFIKSSLALLALLPALFSCQSEAPQESKADKKEFTVRAYIDTPEDTRAAIEYGYGYNEGDENKEIFTWVNNGRDRDYITLFNLSKFSDFHQTYKAPLMYVKTIKGKQAEFAFDPEDDAESSNNALFQENMEPGDTILAVVCEAHAAKLADCDPVYSNVISYEAASQLYDQKIVKNPTTENAMRHVHMMMHLYDVVIVDENGNIPDLHFKHMSSIFRVTLQNKTGKPLFSNISEIIFTAHSTDMSAFIYGFNYFAVVGNENGGFHLEENFKLTPPRHPLNPTKPAKTIVLSHKTKQQINYISADKIPLDNGETYEFYAVVTPRIGSQKFTPEVVDSLTIDVFSNGAESGYYEYYDTPEKGKPDRYTITIDNFNRKIEPGKRYWFKLTATNDSVKVKTNVYDGQDKVTDTKEMDAFKLVFTSQYKDPEDNKDDNGENTSPDE